MENPQQHERAQAELLRQALKLAPLGVYATLVNACIIAVVLWNAVPRTSLIIWLSASICLGFQRYFFLHKYQKVSLEPREVVRITNIFVVSLGMAGMVWGTLGIFLFPLNSPTHQTLIVFVLCGMVAGAAETFASVLPAFIAFALPALVPLLIRFLTIGGAVYYAMSAMTLFYITLTIIIAKRINITNRELIGLKEHFSRAAEELAASNAQLSERTAELSASNRAFITYAERLERLNEELQDFAFIASHDLQEPLRKIRTFCDLIEKKSESELDGTTRDYLHRIMSSAVRMRSLLSDLRHYSRLASKPQPLKVIDLAKVAREAASVFEETIKDTGGVVEIEHMPAIEGDEIQILRLFQNLIANALKYRSIEPPRIFIYARQDVPGICEIFVKDNGIGFDSQFAERIFKPFQTLRARNVHEGTGMGLTICRKIAERHAGSLRAESEPGKGATFIVSLPLRQYRSESI
jgi:signal transduction histidine kinase